MLFAALFAVIALLPKQGNFTPVVTATSVVGFLLIIWDLIKGGQAAGWALIVIVVLSALQTVVADRGTAAGCRRHHPARAAAQVRLVPAIRRRLLRRSPPIPGRRQGPAASMRTRPRASARLRATLRSSATRAGRRQATSRRSRCRRSRHTSPGRRRRPPASRRTRSRPAHPLLRSNSRIPVAGRGRPSWRRPSSNRRRRPALRRRKQALLALGLKAESGP